MRKLLATAVFVGALAFLLLATAHAAAPPHADYAEVMVAPDTIHDRHFSFAVPQLVAGEAVFVQALEGVVVQQLDCGRVRTRFLAAGLPAGAYLISGNELLVR